MVYCGKPSEGCSSCRRRKIRCDLNTPSCGQCVRNEQKCPGYRNMLDLMFRDESNHVIKRARATTRVKSARNGRHKRIVPSSSPVLSTAATLPPRPLDIRWRQPLLDRKSPSSEEDIFIDCGGSVPSSSKGGKGAVNKGQNQAYNAYVSTFQLSTPEKPDHGKSAGCKTCRIRKVRCDETWPTCRSCIKAGRQCNWVSSPAAKVESTALLTLSNVRPRCSRVAQNEVPYLDMFRHRLIYSIIGDVARPSWQQLILQAVHEEPAMHHAAIAYSALVGLENNPDTPINSKSAISIPRKELALRHYNKCIKDLQRIISRQDGTSTNTGLLCILLCICFELRIKNPFFALGHLAHCLRIIKSNTASVDDEVLLAYARLDLQASVFNASRIPTLDSERLAMCTTGTGSELADKHLTSLSNRIVSFVRAKAPEVEGNGENTEATQRMQAELQALDEKLQDFRRNFLSTELPGESEAAALTPATRITWLKYLTVRIMLGRCGHTEETAYDAYTSEFAAIVRVADQTVREQDVLQKNASSVDMSIVPPVYLAAQKCRSPVIRRHAVHILSMIMCIEGVWDVSLCIGYARRLITLEEEELQPGRFRGLEFVGPEEIPEHCRVHDLIVVPNLENQSSVLTFYRRRGGEWDTLVELVHWQ